MNNIAQKNVIYNLSVNSELPYQKTNQVSLKANQIIYTAINHSFDKMVDNDLYNEKAIFSNANYAQGPKPEANIDIALKADGYKIWPSSISSSESDLSILHKNVLTLQQSLSAVTLDSEHAYRISAIVKGRPGYLVIATWNDVSGRSGKAFATTDINDLATLHNIRINGTTSAPIGAVEIDNTIYLLMTDGVRKVVSDTFDGIDAIETKVAISAVSYPTTFEIHDGKYVVGNSNGLSSFLNDGTTFVRACNDTANVHDVKSLGDVALAATESGIYASTYKYQFVTTELELPTGVVPNFTHVFNKKTFVATDKGLYVVNGNALSLVGKKDARVTSLCEFNNDLYVGFDNQNGVCRVDISDDKISLSSVSIFNLCSIKGLGNYSNGKMLVAVTAGGICYTTPDLQKKYLISSTSNSTIATGIGDDVFVANENSVFQVSAVDKTFFELTLRDNLNIKQFLDAYAIDDKNIYKQNSAGKYEQDTAFASFSVSANGISKATTADSRDVYVIYGNSNSACIQAAVVNIDGSRVILNYKGIQNANVISVFNLGTDVVIAVKGASGASSALYLIPTETFFDSSKCNTLTFDDATSYTIDGEMTSIANDNDDSGDDYVFYVVDGKLYVLKACIVGLLDNTSYKNEDVLADSAINDIHVAQNSLNTGAYNIVCWQTTGKGVSAIRRTYDSATQTYISEESEFAMPFLAGTTDAPLEADVFDFLTPLLDDNSDVDNSQKHYGASYIGSHTFIAASTRTATEISSMSTNLGFSQLSDKDGYFAPTEEVATQLTRYPNLTYAFADCSLDPAFPEYEPSRQLDGNGNVARYEIIGNGQQLSALHLSPTYIQLPAFPDKMQIYKQWAMPLDRDFAYSIVVSSYICKYPEIADVLFAAKGTSSANRGIWHLKDVDKPIEDIDSPINVFDTTENIIDVFSYNMSIGSSGSELTSQFCTYDLVCYSDNGVSTFQYLQKRTDDEDSFYQLSVGNVRKSFSGKGITHISIESNGSMYMLSTYTYVDKITSTTATTNGIVRIESGKATIIPALSAGINAFEVIQTSAIVAHGTDLCVIADIDKNSIAASIPASDVTCISKLVGYTSSKKFYTCADKELSEFAVFYNDNNIALWSNSTYDAVKAYQLSTYTAVDTIECLQLNESRHNYLPSITYKAGRMFYAIQSVKANTDSDSMQVVWKIGPINVGTADVSNISAYSYFNDIFFFGGSIVWSDASTTSKFFMPDYQLSSTVLGQVPSSTASIRIIRNVAVDQRFEDEYGNKAADKALAQVFIATSKGLYYDYLSVGTTSDGAYSRKELSSFVPTLLSSDVGNLRQFSVLSSADIQAARVNNHVLHLVVYISSDNEFPYEVYSASLAVLDAGVDDPDNEVQLVLEYKIPASEVPKGKILKLCDVNGDLAFLANRRSDSELKLYDIDTATYMSETDFSSKLGSSASHVFQVKNIPFKADSNGISAISSVVASSSDKLYTLVRIGDRNIGNVQTMSYTDDRFFASGNKGLSTFNIDEPSILSSIPELSGYSLCANDGLDAFSLSGSLSGVYIPTYYDELSVVSKLAFPKSISDIQMIDSGALYVTDIESNVSSLQAFTAISECVPTKYVISGNNVKKVFNGNTYALLKDSNSSLIETAGKSTVDKPCETINYIGDSYLFGMDGTALKAYRCSVAQTQLIFTKALSLPASYQLLSIDSSTALIAGKSGVSALHLDDIAAGKYEVSQTDIRTLTQCIAYDQTTVDRWTGKIIPKVLAGTTTMLLSSENAMTGYADSNILTLPSDIYSIFPVNSYTYLIGTDKNGLYSTSYRYVFSDDLNVIPFSTIDTKIKNTYAESISEHIKKYHSSDSAVTYINDNVMPIDVSKISDTWQTIDLGNSVSPSLASNFKVIENDIVESIDYGDVIQHIKVEYSNILTHTSAIITKDGYTEVSGISYICKKWKSGLIDLFISIPTTNTCYFPHTIENDPCYYNTDIIDRKNFSGLSLSGDIDSAATTFKITIWKKYFGQINNIVNIELNAQSLPLAIYKDKTYDDSYGNFFHSCIMPSLVLGQELYNDKIVIKCKCFGSDAQALHILADV